MRTAEQKADQSAKQKARYRADPVKSRLRNQVQHRLYRERHPDRVREKQRAYYLANQERIKAEAHAYYHSHRQEASASKRLAAYGLTRDGYEAMLAEQRNLCAICRQPESRIRAKTGLVMRLAVDHDHRTGAVRGLLCWRCNSLLSHADDDADRLRAAAGYVERNRP